MTSIILCILNLCPTINHKTIRRCLWYFFIQMKKNSKQIWKLNWIFFMNFFYDFLLNIIWSKHGQQKSLWVLTIRYGARNDKKYRRCLLLTTLKCTETFYWVFFLVRKYGNYKGNKTLNIFTTELLFSSSLFSFWLKKAT